jgi:hypothetical protein
MTLAATGVLAAGAACSGAPGTSSSPDPNPGCCQELVTLYEASIFKVNVMRVGVRVDAETAAAVRGMVSTSPRSAPLEDEVARRYQAAPAATVGVEFLITMSGETFITNSIKSLRGLVGDGQLPAEAAERLSGEARARFGFLTAAGIRPADRIRYDVVADTVTTNYLRAEQVLMHDRQVGSLHRNALLASYFAPSSDFRRGLLDQVFRR